MLANMGYDGFKVVVIAVGGRLVTLSLMPDEHLDIVILWKMWQAVVNLAFKCLQQRFSTMTGRNCMTEESGVGTPVKAVGT